MYIDLSQFKLIFLNAIRFKFKLLHVLFSVILLHFIVHSSLSALLLPLTPTHILSHSLPLPLHLFFLFLSLPSLSLTLPPSLPFPLPPSFPSSHSPSLPLPIPLSLSPSRSLPFPPSLTLFLLLT